MNPPATDQPRSPAEPTGAGEARRVLGARLRWHTLVFGALLVAALVLHAFDRGHLFEAPWDESVHALVAEHLAQHPLHPTVYEIAALTPSNNVSLDWTTTWLHVPPLGMWAAALSMRLLGDTPFAFRLPGLLFVGLGMVIIYLLGRRLFGPLPALVGVAIAGFAPYPLLISQGYAFGDMTDVPLMLLTPLTIWALVRAYQTGHLRWMLLAGAGQGLCYLDKSGIGLAPTGVALALFACERLLPAERGWARLGVRGLLGFAGCAILFAAPYNLFITHVYASAAARESASWRDSFFTNVEDWGRPLDYHVTTYLFAMYGPPLALLVLGAFLVVAGRALLRRSRADLVLVVWALSVYLPMSVAVTKTVNVTYSVVPAVGLMVGRAVLLGLRSRYLLTRAGTLGVLLGSAATAVFFLLGQLGQFAVPYESVMPARFYPTTLDQRVSLYLIEAGLSVGLALACAVVLGLLRRQMQPADLPTRATGPLAPFVNDLPLSVRQALRPTKWVTRIERTTVAVCISVAVLLLAGYWLRTDIQIVSTPRADSAPVEALGALVAQHTPHNATILMSSATPQIQNVRLRVMFWAHRDVYSLPLLVLIPPPGPAPVLDSATICPLVTQAARAASPLYVLTDQPYTGAPLGMTQGWTLYTPACP